MNDFTLSFKLSRGFLVK